MNRYDEKMRSWRASPLGIARGIIPTPLSDAQLIDLETELGHPLPEDYREFIKDYGAYQVNYPCFEATTDSDQTIVVEVGTFKGAIPNPLIGEECIPQTRRDLLENLEDWSPTWLPIASSGNIVIALTFYGEKSGEVLYTDPAGGVHQRIANSFDKFMNHLQ